MMSEILVQKELIKYNKADNGNIQLIIIELLTIRQTHKDLQKYSSTFLQSYNKNKTFSFPNEKKKNFTLISNVVH